MIPSLFPAKSIGAPIEQLLWTLSILHEVTKEQRRLGYTAVPAEQGLSWSQ